MCMHVRYGPINMYKIKFYLINLNNISVHCTVIEKESKEEICALKNRYAARAMCILICIYTKKKSVHIFKCDSVYYG